STLVSVGGRLSDDRTVRRGAAVAALAEVALEPFKKICPAVGADDEHVAAVVLVPLAAQIAECAERIQGASDHRLRYAENAGKAANRVRTGGQVDHHQEGHLPVGQIRLTRADIGDKRLHPAGKRYLAHDCSSPSRAA